MTDIKPCPFCGGPADYLHGYLYCNRVQCRHCGAMTATDDIKAVTVQWNQRFISRSDILAIVNGWLDCERFAHDLSDDEQMACETVMAINIRRQKELEGRECPN